MDEYGESDDGFFIPDGYLFKNEVRSSHRLIASHLFGNYCCSFSLLWQIFLLD